MRYIRAAATLLVALLLAAPAAAQSLRLPAAVFLAASQADSATTYWGQKSYRLREVNPMYSRMSPEGNVAAGLVVDAATLWAAARLGRRHPKLAAVALYALAAMRAEMVRETLGHIATQRARDARRAAPAPQVVFVLGWSDGGPTVGVPVPTK